MKDSKIKIHATINGHGILLITKAAIGVRDGLLVDSLTYFDDDLTFREPTKVVAINRRDGRSYEFEAQSIGPVETKYGKFHLIRCAEDGEATNRRKSERYDIDKLGVIRINGGGDMRNALIYDLSMKGISFILDSEAVCKVGDRISASFRYDPNYFHFYACESTVVRKFNINGQVAIGCRMDSMGADLITLISNKHKEKNGVPVEDILGIASSPDSDIASGNKVPVNYVPPLHTPEILEESIRSGKDALIKEIIHKRNSDESSHSSDKEKDSRSPLSDSGVAQGNSKDASASGVAQENGKYASALGVAQGNNKHSSASDVAQSMDKDLFTSPAGQGVNLSSSMSDIEQYDLEEGQYISLEEAESLIPERPQGIEEIEDRTPRKDIYGMENTLYGQDFDSIDNNRNPHDSFEWIEDRTPHSKRSSYSEMPQRDRNPLPQRRGFDTAPPGRYTASSLPDVDPGRTLANAANASNASIHLPKSRDDKASSAADYDGYFNQSGFAVDENLFLKGGGDGFLTPEQIADIIELERIHRRDF